MPPAAGATGSGGGPTASWAPPAGAAAPVTDVTTALGMLSSAVHDLQGAISSTFTGQASTTTAPALPEAPPIDTGGADAAPAPTDPAAAGGGGSPRDRIVQLAREELAKNVREDAGSDADSAGNIVRYRGAVDQELGGDPTTAEAWCADFASYIWKTAGSPFGPEGKGDDWTKGIIRTADEMGAYKKDDPKPGDMVLIDWQGGRGGDVASDIEKVNHVAIVEKVENGRIYTIGGNESDPSGNEADGVRAADYAVDSNLILGYVSPPGG